MHDSASTTALDSAEAAGHSFVQSSAFEGLSRAGFVARALIYAIIGVLAVKLAFGDGGKLTNQEGALQTIAQQPFGKVLLTLVAIALGGYSLWRLRPRCDRARPRGLGHVALNAWLRSRAGLCTEPFVGSRCRFSLGRAEAARGSPKKAHRRRFRLARGEVDRRHRRSRDGRSRPLPGLPRAHEEVSQGLQGGGDVAGDEDVDHPDRHGRAPRADGRLRPRRGLPGQGRDRLQPEARQSGSTVRLRSSSTTPTGRCSSGSSPWA